MDFGNVTVNRNLRIRVFVKEVTGVPSSFSHQLLRLNRKYYISATIDSKTTRTRNAQIGKNSNTVEWGESLTLHGTKASVVKLQLHAKHTIRNDEVIGMLETTLADLLPFKGNPDAQSVLITRPLMVDGDLQNVQITFAIDLLDNSHDDIDAIQANDHILQNEVDIVDARAMEKIMQVDDVWNPLLDRIRAFVKLVSDIAEIHPYAKMAWSVLTFAYKIYDVQIQRDRKVIELLNAMNDAFAFVDEAKAVEQSRSQRKILEQLTQQTVECGYFITSYSKDSTFIARAGKHLITDVDDVIAQYKSKFSELLEAYKGRVMLQTEITTFSIANGVHELARDIDLMDMPYADGARYERRKQCLAGTRVNILDQISNWVVDPDDKRRVCILTGAAGVGKSAIAHTLARRFEDVGRLGSSFCFSKDQVNRTPELVFPTISRDLAGYDPVVKSALGDVIHNRPSLRKTRDLEDQFDNLICTPTRRLSVTGPVFIAIDALDESGDPAVRRNFLSVLLSNLDRLPPNFRIFLTSRAEHDILEFFQGHEDVLFMSMDETASSTHEDIFVYICSRLVDARNRRLPGLGDIQCKALADKSEGLFQWASVACNVIVGGKGGESPLIRYTDLLSSLGPAASPLDSLYDAILSQIFESHKESVIRTFTEVMSLVLTAYEPLSIATLKQFWSHLLNKTLVYNNPDGVRSVLGHMGSLLSGILTNDEGVRPLHTSLRDYLTDPLRSGKFCINLSASHSLLSLANFEVLNAELRFNICGLESSYVPNSQIPDIDARIELHISSRLSYSCRFWGRHLEELMLYNNANGSVLRTESLLREPLKLFLHYHFLHWLEVMSLVKAVNVSYTSLSTAVSFLKDIDSSLSAFASDAQKFVRMFGAMILISCPHIYLSSLPFTPTTSLVRRQYSNLYQKSASVFAGAQSKWPALQNVIISGGPVESITISPDGKRIASGSYSTVRIWDAETGELMGELNGHSSVVYSLAFSLDGKLIVSSSDDTIRIWDAHTYAAVGEPIACPSVFVSSIAISPDGKKIISGSEEETIRMWDVETGAELVKSHIGHTNSVCAVAISPDGQRIVSGSLDNTIRLWDAKTGHTIGDPLQGHTAWIRSVAFSQDGKRIVSCSNDRTICTWNAETGMAIAKPLVRHAYVLYSATFSPDGKRIVSASGGTAIHTWDADTGEAVGEPLRGHTGQVLSAAFSPDGKRIISCSIDGTVCIWDAETETETGAILKGYAEAISFVAFSLDGERIMSGSDKNIAGIWDAETGVGEVFKGHVDLTASNCVAFSPDGERIVSGDLNWNVRIWDAKSGTTIGKNLIGHTDGVQGVAYSPDGKKIISCSRDMTIRVWDAERGTDIGKPLKGHTYWVQSVAFSPDGKYIVSGSGDKSIRIWDIETGHAVGKPLKGHEGWVDSVAFSSDGKRIVSGSDDWTVRIWDVKTGVALGQPLKGHTDRVCSVAFSPDGKRVVSGSDDKIIYIWDVERGVVSRESLEGHTDGVLCVAFSPNGKQIASGSQDSTIRVWNVEPVSQFAVISSEMNSRTDVIPPSSFATTAPRLPSAMSPTIAFSLHAEHAMQLGELLPKLDPTKYLGGIEYNSDAGWILGPGKELIFWVPPSLRKGLIVPRNTAICDERTVEIDFSRFVHGSSWIQCYTPVV